MLIDQERASFEDFLKSQLGLYLNLKNRLNEAVLYSLESGGKRIRPLLCLAFSRAFAGRQALALRSAVAVELIHTYSLIHDDLPAMDNDDERRGKPTNHKVYGEGVAILAGDALLNLAPEYLLIELSNMGMTPELIIEMTTSLLQSSGHKGMILGQVLDMEAEGKSGDIHKLHNIHDKKTAALIRWSCLAGLYSTMNPEKIETHKEKVGEMGRDFGVLFQIIDDISDAIQDTRAGKFTYVSLLGTEGARKEAKNLVQHLMANMEKIPGDWSMVKEVLNLLDKGPT